VITLRTASAADVLNVLAFWQTSAEGAHRPPDSQAAVLRLLDRDPNALILAEEGGRIVGSVIAGWDGWRCHLYRLAVAPDRRRRGIGTALLKRAEERFLALDGTRVDAMVLRDNLQAHQAWQANGFRAQPEWARWVKPLG